MNDHSDKHKHYLIWSSVRTIFGEAKTDKLHLVSLEAQSQQSHLVICEDNDYIGRVRCKRERDQGEEKERDHLETPRPSSENKRIHTKINGYTVQIKVQESNILIVFMVLTVLTVLTVIDSYKLVKVQESDQLYQWHSIECLPWTGHYMYTPPLGKKWHIFYTTSRHTISSELKRYILWTGHCMYVFCKPLILARRDRH